MRQKNKNRRVDPEETEITQKIIGSVLNTILVSYEDVRGCSGVGRGGQVWFGLFALLPGLDSHVRW